jgi:hypothetical protein
MAMLLWLFREGVSGGLSQLSDQALLCWNLPPFGLVNVQAPVQTPAWAQERLRWKRQWAVSWKRRLTAGAISGFRRDVCALLGYYTASSGDVLPTFRDNLSVPTTGFVDFLSLRMGPDRWYRKVGKKLPLLAA